MRRRWIAVARPRNWRAVMVGAIAVIACVLFGVLVLLIDLPAQTIGEVWIDPVWMRLGLLCLVYLVGQALVPLSLGFLSSAPMLWGSRVRVQVRGRRFRIHLREIREVELELRPRGEIAVLCLHSGVKLDLCPMRWHGAATLIYSVRAAVHARVQADPPSAVPQKVV